MKRQLAQLSLTGLVCGLSACTSVAPGVATIGPQQSPAPVAAKVATLTGPGELAHSSLPPSLQAIDPRTAYHAPVPAAYPQSRSYIQQMSHWTPSAEEAVSQNGQLAIGDSAYCPPAGCPPLPMAPRVELPSVCGVEQAATSAELFPDEYICDGGDEGFPTRVEQDGSVVLQFEETVGTFYDEKSEVHVEPSTRVCVYSPTFGAVSTISQQVVDLSIDKLAGTHFNHRAAGYDRLVGPETGEKVDIGLQTTMRARPSELDALRADAVFEGVTAVQKHLITINVFQDYNFLRGRLLDGVEIAAIREGVAAAIMWQKNEAPIIVGKTDSLLQIQGRVMAEEYFNVEEPPSGDLRLIKTADVHEAHPGEEVKFAIRFDNTGGQAIYDVTVTDHLSPRLELVAGSVECDLDSEVVIENDGEGSIYLKINLNEPLEPNSGGVITFTTRVR